jgi:hypothetical protein
MRSRDGEPGDLEDCYEFAKAQGLYEARPWSERKMFKLEMSRAISRERTIDDDGNPVRLNHVFRVPDDVRGQLYFWGELLKMKPAQVTTSLKQRLHGLGNRAVQIERDKSYYNEKNTDGGRVDLDYNLNLFVQNAMQDTSYPDERPDDDQE